MRRIRVAKDTAQKKDFVAACLTPLTGENQGIA
jgi:hypothetical protein